MVCHNCRIEMVKAGIYGPNKVQRKCQRRGKRFSEPQQKPFGEDVRLPNAFYYQKQSAAGKEEGVIRITDERG